MILQLLLGLLFCFTFYKVFSRKKCIPNFNNKTVWITGASSGIGQSLAYQFNLRGANIIISSRSLQQLKKVKNNCPNPQKVEVVYLDMTKFDEIEQVTAQLIQKLQQSNKKLDIVVENAGISMRCQLLDYSFKNHLSMFDLNVNGPYKHIQCFVEHMVKNKSGQIVAISSAASKLAKGYRSSYAGSKHAISGILDSLRSQLYPFGVTITNILPGYVQTNLSKNALSSNEGQKFGVTDQNISKGMHSDQLARIAVQAVYRKQKQLQISNTWDVPIGIFLRNIFPDLFFLLMRFNAKTQARAAKKSK